MKHIYTELNKVGLHNVDLTFIRIKDGIELYSFTSFCKQYILKYFQNSKDRDEIFYYELLDALSIKTLPLFKYTDKMMILEDVNESEYFRLATQSDLQDEKTVISCAKWYRDLHDKSLNFVRENKNQMSFYREFDQFSIPNIELLKSTLPIKSEAIDLLISNYKGIIDYYYSIDEVINYNDFSHTNMVVGTKYEEAMMFDYNLMGIGHRYADIRNVCSQLSDPMQTVFKEAYGSYEEKSVLFDDCIAPVIGVLFALQRTNFPNWAVPLLEEVQSEEYLQKVTALINDLKR